MNLITHTHQLGSTKDNFLYYMYVKKNFKPFALLVMLKILPSDTMFTNNETYCSSFHTLSFCVKVRITQPTFECLFVRLFEQMNIRILVNSFGPYCLHLQIY